MATFPFYSDRELIWLGAARNANKTVPFLDSRRRNGRRWVQMAGQQPFVLQLSRIVCRKRPFFD